MGNVISYVDEYGGFTFAEKPFCELDGLIFAHFSYFIYTGIVHAPGDNRPAVQLSDVAQKINWDRFISVKWEPEKNRELFYKTAFSRRFRKTGLNFLVEELDRERDVQFCAVTFLLGNGDVFLSFRGTDDELIGWREDFDMAYRTPVEAQIRSTEYVNRVAELLARKRGLRLYLGGHSKGGNLAVYAAMTCKESIKPKIGRIYDMDGPGFRPDFMETLDYAGMRDKILKIVPDESFIGMLMETGTDFELIKSSEIGLRQHACFSWSVEGDRFERAENQVPKRKELYDKINRWIFELDRELVGEFIDALFGMIEVTEASTLTELKEAGNEMPKRLHALMRIYAQISDDTKRVFWDISRFMAEMMAADGQERMRRGKAIDKIRQRLEQ